MSLVIPITGILLPLFLVPTVMTMRLRQRKREWEHLERMKSLELGLPVPVVSTGGGVVAIGAGVPIAAFLAALVTTIVLISNSPDFGPFKRGGSIAFEPGLSIPIMGMIWGSAVSVSLFAILIALILGVVQARAMTKALQSNQWAGTHAKPTFDPEAYEFSGRHS